MPGNHRARVFGDRDDGISLFHAVFLNVVNPPAGICAGAVELGSVQMHHQRFTCGLFHFHTCQIGHPIMCVHHIEIVVASHDRTDFGELNNLAGQIAGIEVFLSGEQFQIGLVHTGEEQLASFVNVMLPGVPSSQA